MEVVPVMASKNPIKCIAFDIGGTLHRNSSRSKRAGWEMKLRVLKNHGYSIPFTAFKKALDAAWLERNAAATGGRFELDALILTKLNIPPSPSLVREMVEAFYSWRMQDTSPARISPGVKSLLTFLERRNILVGVISIRT